VRPEVHRWRNPKWIGKLRRQDEITECVIGLVKACPEVCGFPLNNSSKAVMKFPKDLPIFDR